MSDKNEKPDYELLKTQWLKELKNNPKVQIFLESYKQSDWEYMYKHYVNNKMLAVQYADQYKNQNEGRVNEWVVAAKEHLNIIQQKKLFDAHCKWRAGIETFEGVEICFDFEVWENDVLNCPFLEPPTDYDIELYSQFLNRENNIELEFESEDDWQDYDGLKEAYNTNEQNRNFPEWYEFHNSRTGNGILLTLPDVRGKLEEFYKDLARKEKQKDAKPYIPPLDIDKPYLNYYDKKIQLDFAKFIEDKEMFSIFKSFVDATEHHDDFENERAVENLNYLSNVKDELIPIEAHQDYRIALQIACQRYRFKKIAENLPFALEQYYTEKRLKQMGIDSYEDKRDFLFHLELRKLHADSILLGRKLNNEPQDFNF